MKPELFMIDAKAIGALTAADITDTFKAMREVGIGDPPMRHFVIAFDQNIFASDFLHWKNTEEDIYRRQKWYEAIEKYKNLAIGIEVIHCPHESPLSEHDKDGTSGYFRSRKFHINTKTFKLINEPIETGASEQNFLRLMYQTLIVLLATKNAQKDRVQNRSTSASSNTRNASKNFAYTTTIRIGKITENCKSGGTGSPMRPHLRRGHVRNQRYGEGRREIKQIFIAPVFINADKEYIESQRIAYKIRA